MVVIHAVSGRDMDEARAGVGRDEVRRIQVARAVAERVFVFERREFVRRSGVVDLVGIPAELLRHLFEQRVGHVVDAIRR